LFGDIVSFVSQDKVVSNSEDGDGKVTAEVDIVIVAGEGWNVGYVRTARVSGGGGGLEELQHEIWDVEGEEESLEINILGGKKEASVD